MVVNSPAEICKNMDFSQVELLKWKTILLKHKVPHPYSGADDIAPSLTGCGMTKRLETSDIH